MLSNERESLRDAPFAVDSIANSGLTVRADTGPNAVNLGYFMTNVGVAASVRYESGQANLWLGSLGPSGSRVRDLFHRLQRVGSGPDLR